MDKEMEVLLSEKDVKLGDKTVVVKRIALLDTIRLASRVSDVLSILLNTTSAFDNAIGKIFYNGRPKKDSEGNDIQYESAETENDVNGVRILGILELVGLVGSEGVELLKDIIRKSTNLEGDDIENIDCVNGIDLLSEIYEVNKGFFVKCMSKLKEKLGKRKPKSGKKEK